MSFLCTRLLVYINYFVLNVSSFSPLRVRIFGQVPLIKWHCWLSPLSNIVRESFFLFALLHLVKYCRLFYLCACLSLNSAVSCLHIVYMNNNNLQVLLMTWP